MTEEKKKKWEVRYNRELSPEMQEKLKEIISDAKKKVTNFDHLHEAILTELAKNISLSGTALTGAIFEEYSKLINTSSINSKMEELLKAGIIETGLLERTFKVFKLK